jgi:hypothetical protein
MDSERKKLSQLSNISEDILDKFLTAIYDRLKSTGDIIDSAYSDVPHHIKAGDIITMDETQRELFYGIINDCYKGLITMPEVEHSGDKFIIKIYDSKNGNYREINSTSLELINDIIFTMIFYIYKLENSNVTYGFLKNDFQKYEFAKLYTLILNIPDMPERIINLASDINSRGENIPFETYDAEFAKPEHRVLPPPPEQGWYNNEKSENDESDSKKGGVKRKTARKRVRKNCKKSSRKRVRKSYRK